MFTKRPVISSPPVSLPAYSDPSVPSKACCCPARPAVKVTLPPGAGHPHPVELWLCGHHYRASAVALKRAGAAVEDLTRETGELPPLRVPPIPRQSSGLPGIGAMLIVRSR